MPMGETWTKCPPGSQEENQVIGAWCSSLRHSLSSYPHAQVWLSIHHSLMNSNKTSEPWGEMQDLAFPSDTGAGMWTGPWSTGQSYIGPLLLGV